MLKAGDLTRREDHQVRGVKSGRTRQDWGISHVCSRAANSVVHGQILQNFELIQTLMYIIVTCKYEMNLIKNVRENVMTPFFPL